MANKLSNFLKKYIRIIPLTTIIVIFALHGCKSKKTENSFILDNIQYEINDGGLGYNVNNDNSFDLNKSSFVAALHIINLSKSSVNLDSSKFKLTDENGTVFSLETKMNNMDVSAMYDQKIEPGEAIDYMLTFTIPKKGHYNLHIISPISGREQVIHY
jgi:hypothetical protein